MIITRKALVEKYKQLARLEKEIIGESLVKVNLGVALPVDQRRVAAFLKGSEFIAKPETLDDLIAMLHEESAEKNPRESTQLLKNPDAFNTTAAEKLRHHPEDSVVTSREKIRK